METIMTVPLSLMLLHRRKFTHHCLIYINTQADSPQVIRTFKIQRCNEYEYANIVTTNKQNRLSQKTNNDEDWTPHEKSFPYKRIAFECEHQKTSNKAPITKDHAWSVIVSNYWLRNKPEILIGRLIITFRTILLLPYCILFIA